MRSWKSAEEWAWRIVNTKEVKMKKIQILGTGCPKCKKLTELAEKAAKELDIQYELEKVTDLSEIMDFGVMVTPALVVDGEVKIVGKVPKIDNIKKMLS
jgi:small redox-active disulfide protein 2